MFDREPQLGQATSVSPRAMLACPPGTAPDLGNSEAPAIWSPIVGFTQLQLHDILPLQSFGALCHFDFDAIAFVQRLEAAALNRGVMNKNVTT